MIASADEPDDRVDALIQLGRRQGYLTYEVLNERLPDEVISPEQLDAFLFALDSEGIRLIDEEERRIIR